MFRGSKFFFWSSSHFFCLLPFLKFFDFSHFSSILFSLLTASSSQGPKTNKGAFLLMINISNKQSISLQWFSTKLLLKHWVNCGNCFFILAPHSHDSIIVHSFSFFRLLNFSSGHTNNFILVCQFRGHDQIMISIFDQLIWFWSRF